MNRKNYFRASAVVALAIITAAPQYAAGIRRLTLTEAVHLAIAQNRALKIARLKVTENENKKARERSAYFPTITNQSNALRITDLQIIEFPVGTFGSVQGIPIPTQNLIVPQGQLTLFSSGTTISQPLTQLIRIHAANRIAAAEVAASRDDLKKAENQVALDVHNLYFGILIARLQKTAAERQVAYAGEHLRESEEDVRNGAALKVAAIEGRASVLEGQQSVLAADLQL
jgi:outer membrane protein TolC